MNNAPLSAPAGLEEAGNGSGLSVGSAKPTGTGAGAKLAHAYCLDAFLVTRATATPAPGPLSGSMSLPFKVPAGEPDMRHAPGMNPGALSEDPRVLQGGRERTQASWEEGVQGKSH